MKSTIKLTGTLGVICLGFLLYCTQNGKIAGVVDDTDTSIRATLFNPDGTKAVGAVVKFFAPQDTSKNEKYSVTTNSEGTYSVNNISTGNYNVWAAKDSLVAFQANVYISGDTNFIKQDTLKYPASITGIVGVEPNHNPENVTVQVLGTESYSMVDANRKFTLKYLGEGSFTLRFTTTDPGYVATLYNWSTTRAKADTIADTIWVKYNGIPVVRGLTAKYDTANGVVRLQWNKTKFQDIQDYYIYRDVYDSIVFSTAPIAACSDTFFVDTIFKKNLLSGKYSFADSGTYKFKYRVAVRNNSQKVGETYKYATASASSYQNVIPKIKTVSTVFDTAQGIVNVTWDSVATFTGFGGYCLIRTILTKSIANYTINSASDTLGILQQSAFFDSLFENLLSFSDSTSYIISYSVCSYRNDWNRYGKFTPSNSVTIVPYYTKVPVVNNTFAIYDTLKGTVRFSWDSAGSPSLVAGYFISRRIVNASGSLDTSDTFTIKNTRAFIDTIFPKFIGFTNITNTSVSYAISVKHSSWGITGVANTKNISIYSYKKYTPVVYAGPTQNVDISSDVVLQGSIVSSAWPVKKVEWKIGDSTWIDANRDSMKTGFATNSNFNTETTVCIIRVTDYVGNVGVDTVNVVKQQLVVNFGRFPCNILPIQATRTTLDFNNTWLIGQDMNLDYLAWSTTDFRTWKLEGTTADIQNSGSSFKCGDIFYRFPSPDYLHSNVNAVYKSQDQISWTRIWPDFSTEWGYSYSNICTKDGKLYMIGKYWYNQTSVDTLFTSDDGTTWHRTALSFNTYPDRLVHYKQNLYMYSIFFGNTQASPIMSSTDNGLTWIADQVWDDNNFITYPDVCYNLVADDSVMVAVYLQQPQGAYKASIFRNGIWSNLPLPFSFTYFYYGLFLFKNRLIYISGDPSNYSVNSIKLY